LAAGNPQISVAVLSYKNTEFLYECLDSIFSQTYDNIELIVSNDGAIDFDICAVKRYVEENAKENITNIVVNKNKCNMGTVKHCNTVLGMSNGEYIILIGCDDAFNNNKVFMDMVDGFKSVPSDVMIIVCQTEMRDESLCVCNEFYVKENTKRVINSLSPLELYRSYLSLSALFPAASIIYRREVFEKYGGFDEDYFLIEDWPASVSFAKQGVRSYYLDIIAVNHRDGGVSHSELVRESRTQWLYVLDTLRCMESVLVDSMIDAQVLDIVNRKSDWWIRRYFEIWGDKVPMEFLESLNTGVYISNHLKHSLEDK